MAQTGRVKNGVAVLDEAGATWPDGAEVRVEVVAESARRTLAERFKDVIGKAEGLPEDFAANHCRYLRGVPKEQ